MLKIKDNVDLKELEKFEFIDNSYSICNTKYSYLNRCGSYVYKIFIDKKDRTIHYNSPSLEVYDLLYDLIKADLVEKVEV